MSQSIDARNNKRLVRQRPRRTASFILAFHGALFAASAPAAGNELPDFSTVPISDKAHHWWARTLADVNGDGLLDIVLQDNNSQGGWLGWLEASDGAAGWARHLIARKSPDGEDFASGDLKAGDIDNDGGIDVVGVAHPGEHDKERRDAPSALYWYSNPEWVAHRIGESPAFVKDLNLVDFDEDGNLDLVTATFIINAITIFRQDTPHQWTKIQEFEVENLHEGMDVGDIDGDGDSDIATNGYWIENPGGDLSEKWTVRSIDAKWHTQEGDWSRNASKIVCADVNGDGRAEVFIAHSERDGYPLSYYQSDDPRAGEWTEHVIKPNLPAAHTLQVFDADLDGDPDVLAGVNKSRAQRLGFESFPVILFLNGGDNAKWEEHVLSTTGIYNGQAGDVDGDGDIDIIRLSAHDATRLELFRNELK